MSTKKSAAKKSSKRPVATVKKRGKPQITVSSSAQRQALAKAEAVKANAKITTATAPKAASKTTAPPKIGALSKVKVTAKAPPEGSFRAAIYVLAKTITDVSALVEAGTAKKIANVRGKIRDMVVRGYLTAVAA